MLVKNKRLFIILAVIIVLLLIPLLAMQFTQEVQWTTRDFLTMGVLLLITGISCEIILRKVKKPSNRILFCFLMLLLFLLIWAELAVGVFGTPFAGS